MIIKVVQDNYSSRPAGITPAVGAIVTGSDVYYCGNVRHAGTFASSTTNSSGFGRPFVWRRRDVLPEYQLQQCRELHSIHSRSASCDDLRHLQYFHRKSDY